MTLPARPPVPIIQLDAFEGPLDLLLSLVERRRLPIAELSLVTVADQYLAQIRSLERIEPDVLSEFVAIGARLLLLKSRSLLPAIEPPPQPGEEEETDGAELVRRLETYRAFKILAEEIGRLDAAGLATYSGGSRAAEPVPELLPLQPIAAEVSLALPGDRAAAGRPARASRRYSTPRHRRRAPVHAARAAAELPSPLLERRLRRHRRRDRGDAAGRPGARPSRRDGDRAAGPFRADHAPERYTVARKPVTRLR
jgi:chromatin segregation and condensation protein Rec8/ScpA/Scc1 (kleisin family)